MSTLVKEVIIPEDRRISIELPPEVQTGEARITVKIEQKKMNRVGTLFGTGKGRTWMSDDFDAPLEDLETPVGKRPLGFLRGRIRVDVGVKDVGGEELIHLFEGGE